MKSKKPFEVSISKKSEKKRYEEYTDEEFEKYLFEFVRAGLRRFSYRWPYRSIATAKARVGFGQYKCQECKEIIRNKDKKLDHIQPVIDPKSGFKGWESFIRRLLVREDGFQVLCSDCHKAKTKEENDVRREVRKANKLDSYERKGVGSADFCPTCSRSEGSWE